jgi:pyridoxal 5'-phosphate synthase pdxT subunit
MLVAALALQGDYDSHLKAALRAFPGAEGFELRTKADLATLEASGGPDLFLVPGGESSAFSLLLEYSGLREGIIGLIAKEKTVTFATCAGAIMLAREVPNPGLAKPLGLMDMVVERNAYGRQVDSFIGRLEPEAGTAPDIFGALAKDSPALEAVFIRAPRISSLGPRASALGRVGGEVVLARQGNMLSCTFHPEQSPSSVVYAILSSMLASRRN